MLLPQPGAHPALAQQTDGPGDGLTNGLPGTRPQEAPPARPARAHGRLLGHPLVSGRRTLGLKGPNRWRVLQAVPGRGGREQGNSLQDFSFYEDTIFGASSDFFFYFYR